MGYLDYAGLQYLWGKLKEKFAPKSHSHDDRYYTEAEMDGKLNSKVNNNEAGADSLLSKLTTSWTATPTDDTYFIRQDTGGGNQFGRVKFSTIWNYIKGKADGVYQHKGSYAASGHTHDDRYYTESEMNTKLSAKAENIILASNTNLNSITTPGFYSCGGGNSISNKPSNIDAIGLIVTHNASGGYYTQILTTSSNANTYRRTCLNGTWSGWTQDKYTDTNTWRGIQNNLTSDSTSDSLSAAQGKALKGLIDGKAPNEHTHQYLSLYGARPANINFTKSTNGTGAMFHFVATSSTTTGKPPDDSSILQLNWDNSGGWDSQLALSTTAKPHVYYRNQQNGTWGNWSTLLDNLNYTDYAAKKEHTHSKSQITDFPASLKNPTALTIQTNGTTAATYDGSAAKTVNVTKGNIGLGNVDNTADKNKSVASAAKLTTVRTVSGGSDITLSFNYDGSENSTANIGFYSCKNSVGNTNNYPFHRFAKLENLTGPYADKTMLVYITQDYNSGGFGICRLSLQTNNSSSASTVEAKWLVRRGLSADFVQVAIYNKYGETYADAFIKTNGSYANTTVRSLSSGGRDNSGRTWTLINSIEVNGTTATDKKTSSECWKTIAEAGTALHKQAYSSSASATDEGYVASAGSANTSSSCTGNSASATKLTSSAGSATQPVYFKDGKPVAGTYTLGDASSKMVRTLGAVGNTGWTNKTTDDKYVPTMSFMAYWNGAYSSTSSNLQYCDRGRFGTIVTKGSGDYAVAGHTHNYAGSGSAGGSANSAVKLDSNAGSSVQPVYFSGGKPVAIGYTISSSVPANAKFTDTTYGVASSSSNGLMSSTDKTKLDDFSRVINIQKQIKLTTDWLDTGIAGNSLDTGTYVVQVSGFNSSYTQLYSEIYSGVMSWYSGTTNSGNSSEIFLHNAGLADNNNAIYLRTLRVAGSKTLKLQIACKVAATGTDTLTFKFRRLI